MTNWRSILFSFLAAWCVIENGGRHASAQDVAPCRRRNFQPASSSVRWYPTNAANAMFIWCETVPFVTSQGGNVDGSSVGFWTNLISGALGPGTLTTDSGNPVFHSTGGGADGNEPRIFFSTNTATRFISGTKNEATFTMMLVMQISNMLQSSSSKIIPIFYAGGVAPYLRYNNGILDMNAGSSVTGTGAITNNWLIITAVFNGASSSITTNGVAYVSGNAGSTLATTYYINNASYAGGFWPLSGNISRIWAWTNVLTAGDMTSAIAQCKTDFGIH